MGPLERGVDQKIGEINKLKSIERGYFTEEFHLEMLPIVGLELGLGFKKRLLALYLEERSNHSENLVFSSLL